MADDERDWAELGTQVKRRREAMLLAQGDLSARGGPGEITVRKIERGDSGPFRAKTLRSLEAALSWREGAVDRIIAGEATDQDLDPNTRFARAGAALGVGSAGSATRATKPLLSTNERPPGERADDPLRGGMIQVHDEDLAARLGVGVGDTLLTVETATGQTSTEQSAYQLAFDTIRALRSVEGTPARERAIEALSALLVVEVFGDPGTGRE